MEQRQEPEADTADTTDTGTEPDKTCECDGGEKCNADPKQQHPGMRCTRERESKKNGQGYRLLTKCKLCHNDSRRRREARQTKLKGKQTTTPSGTSTPKVLVWDLEWSDACNNYLENEFQDNISNHLNKAFEQGHVDLDDSVSKENGLVHINNKWELFFPHPGFMTTDDDLVQRYGVMESSPNELQNCIQEITTVALNKAKEMDGDTMNYGTGSILVDLGGEHIVPKQIFHIDMDKNSKQYIVPLTQGSAATLVPDVPSLTDEEAMKWINVVSPCTKEETGKALKDWRFGAYKQLAYPRHVLEYHCKPMVEGGFRLKTMGSLKGGEVHCAPATELDEAGKGKFRAVLFFSGSLKGSSTSYDPSQQYFSNTWLDVLELPRAVMAYSDMYVVDYDLQSHFIREPARTAMDECKKRRIAYDKHLDKQTKKLIQEK